jgi:hypothetical protein
MKTLKRFSTELTFVVDCIRVDVEVDRVIIGVVLGFPVKMRNIGDTL